MAAKIGMSTPGTELGLGSALQDQVGDSEEELRRRRLREMQGDRLLGPSASAPARALGLSMSGQTSGTLRGGAGLGAYKL
jgi:hypothetical protein